MNKDKLHILLDIGTQLSSEKDYDKLLEHIIRAAMEITDADGGTLYIYSNGCLEFKIMITESMHIFRGGKGDPVGLPPVKLTHENVCAAAVIDRKVINIPDVYDSDKFDFSGPRNYDAMTGYKTKSALVCPMENDHGEIIGVLQLINATSDGKIVPFSKSDEEIIASLASEAAVTLTNMNYSNQVTDLLYGFVRVISTGIDARTPYNANHTRNMVRYAERFFDFERENGGKWYAEGDEKLEILMGIWLHDIGKLTTPLEIMDKESRLGVHTEVVFERFARISLLNRLDHAEGRIDDEEYKKRDEKLKDYTEFVRRVNKAGYVDDKTIEKVNALRAETYTDVDGSVHNFIDDVEKEQLSIRKGTLTDKERQIMQDHVVMTSKMLSVLNFPKKFEHVRLWSESHHEMLNGSGYPNHLTAEEIPWQVRFISIVDIFEALTARDRPYKAQMPIDKAFDILDSMVRDGQIDGEILDEFRKSRSWED